MAALPLESVTLTSWDAGIEHAYGGRMLFVTPTLREEWVLAIGTALLSAETEDVDGTELATTLVQRLSERLSTEVLFFGTHRVVEYHAWMRASSGQLTRSFAHLGESGETLSDAGTVTPEESALGFDSKALEEFEWLPDEEHVLTLAAQWSIDPNDEALGDGVGEGWLGRL